MDSSEKNSLPRGAMCVAAARVYCSKKGAD